MSPRGGTPATPQASGAGGRGGSHAAARRGLLGPLRHPATLVLVWVLTRLWMLHAWRALPGRPMGDPNHYYFSMHHFGLHHALPEYPVWVVWMLAPLRFLAGESQSHFGWLFALLMTLCDVVSTVLLWRHAGRRAAWYWVLFGAAMGASLVWFRFDIVTGTLVTGALMERRRRPGLAGACVALGAAIKLWPVLLVVTLWRRGRAGWRFLAGLVATGAVLLGGAIVTTGWSRVTSPLRWQADRGLQIESIVATPLMLERTFGNTARWHIKLSRYLAYEIFGPHVSTMLRAASVLNGVLLLVVLALAIQSWRLSSAQTVDRLEELYEMSMSTLAVISVFMVANKTFSPQYLYWIAGPLAVLAYVYRPTGGRRSLVLGALGLVLAVLTQILFPVHYNLLKSAHPHGGYIIVLALRNALLVLLAGLAVLWSLVRPRGLGASASPAMISPDRHGAGGVEVDTLNR